MRIRVPALGEFEQVVLLAILRLGDRAYGVTIREEIRDCTNREPTPGALYTTLDRMEEKGLVRSRLGGPTGRSHHPQSDLRGRLSGLFVWVPPGAQPARCAGCTVVRAPEEEGELHSRRGHPRLFGFIFTMLLWLIN